MRKLNITDEERRARSAACVKAYYDRMRKQDPQRLKKSQSDAQRKKLYGVTAAQYQTMIQAQGGVCAICFNTCASGHSLSIDHNHRTGKTRGLLCKKCNWVLGRVNDDPNILDRIRDYLLKYQ